MKTRQYRDLLVWQRSMEFARQIYTATSALPDHELFGLIGQVRRAAVSIPSNIAEGQGRGTDRSFAVFLRQARGSLFELETQMELARNLGLLNADRVAALLRESEEITRMLNGLLRTLRATPTNPS